MPAFQQPHPHLPPSAINGESADWTAPIEDEDDLHEREKEMERIKREKEKTVREKEWEKTLVSRLWGPSSVSQFQCEPWMDSLHFCTNKQHHKLRMMMMMMIKASERIKKKKCSWAAYMAREQPPLLISFFFWQFNKKKNDKSVKEGKTKLELGFSIFHLFQYQYRIWKTWKLTSF